MERGNIYATIVNIGINSIKDATMKTSPVLVEPFRIHRFSLIDVLMMMIIMTILLLLFLPQLLRAREYAKEASCMNNMRQIALGYRHYITDYEAFPTPASGRFLDDLSPSHTYVKSLQVYTCPSTDTKPLESIEQMYTGDSGDFLVTGDVADIELRNSQDNNGLGNNLYKFDPSNTSTTIEKIIAAKKQGVRLLYEWKLANHFPNRLNIIEIDDLHYEREFNRNMNAYWTLDDKGWIDRKLD